MVVIVSSACLDIRYFDLCDVYTFSQLLNSYQTVVYIAVPGSHALMTAPIEHELTGSIRRVSSVKAKSIRQRHLLSFPRLVNCYHADSSSSCSA